MVKKRNLNNKVNNVIANDEEKNIKEILDIVKSSYFQYYERTQSVDNKSGFFIAFHAAILVLLVDIEKINEILNIQSKSIAQIIKYSSIAIIDILVLILAFFSICLFIFSLMSRNIRYLPSTVFSDKYYTCKNLDLNKELLKAYKDISEYNEKIIDKKHTIYNYALIITIIEIVLILIDLIIKVV